MRDVVSVRGVNLLQNSCGDSFAYFYLGSLLVGYLKVLLTLDIQKPCIKLP